MDKTFSARTFYSKLDRDHYRNLYRDKLNAVAQRMDIWSATLEEAYTEIELSIPPKATDTNQSRPAAFIDKSSIEAQ